MKHIFLLILCSLFFIGCDSKGEKYQMGPLSQIKEFDVFTCFSPYEKFDCNDLFKILIDGLKAIGQVEIIEFSCESTPSKMHTLLFLSLGGYQQKNKGSIEIISPVQIEANHYKENCPIWHIKFDGETENLSFPVIENGKVAFKRNDQTLDISKKNDKDPAITLRQMVLEFANAYHHFNPEKERPIFYVYISHEYSGLLPCLKM